MNTNFDELKTSEVVERTAGALTANNFLPEMVSTGAEALARIKELIPAGVSVMNGASLTLEQIGFLDYLKEGTHSWNNLHEGILVEADPAKQKELRRQSVLSDWYLGSAHAVTEDGQILVASNTGSQLPHLVFTSPNIVLVVSTMKIVPTLQDGFARIDQQILPLEDARIEAKFKVHTVHAKTVILHKENPMLGRKVYVIFVNEKLGF